MSPLEVPDKQFKFNNVQENVAEPTAIIGMGCRWPGGIRDAPGLWELLQNKRSGYRNFGDHRFSTKGFYHPDTDRAGTVSTEGGYVLDEDPRLFDPTFFGIQPLEVETMDASQRKLLEVIYEAFENAGETLQTVSGSRTGVFVGNFATDHTVIQSRDSDHPRPYVTTGSSLSLLSNRISYIFNLTGPSLTIDTACSSSMYAIHLAINAMRNGDCDSAIVAACNWIMDPTMQIMMNKLGALSPTSACHTFDVAADGYARGEGFAALYLTKTSIAVERGSPIRALIRGTAINANGRTGGITHPSKAGQEAVIRMAYKNAGNLNLSDTTFFECHGTGTPVGDPIEVGAIGNVFSSDKSSKQDPLYVGSIKTNLGHTESASAIAGIMKVVLALEAGVIPPSINVNTLNPKVDFEKANVKVLTEVTPWPAGQLRRGSINSFGYGGANGHCIIDHVTNYLPNYVKPGVITGPEKRLHDVKVTFENPDEITDDTTDAKSLPSHSPITKKLRSSKRVDADTRQLVLLPVSAHNESSLKLNLAALAGIFNKHSLADIAYTFAAQRTKFSQRSFRIIDKNNPVEGIETEQRVVSSPAEPARLGFVFTGQGAQWHAMGSELFEYRIFKDAIQFLDSVIALLKIDTPAISDDWTIGSVLAGDCHTDLINRPDVSQTVCTAVQIGIIDLLASWSIRPAGVVGHSSGEMAAAYAAGRITAAESIAAAFFRGQAVSKNKKEGAMMAVGLNLDDSLAYINREDQEGLIRVAAINSPNSMTLSGDLAAVTRLSARLSGDGVFNRLLKTGGNAYHSHHMGPLGSDYSDMLSTGLTRLRDLGLCNQDLRYSRISWVSSVTPAKSASGVGMETGPTYWRSNLEQPVRLLEAVTNLMELRDLERPLIDVLVEIGPHPALKGPINQIMTSLGKTIQYGSSLKRGEDGRASILELAGTLFGLNCPVDLAAVNSLDDEEGIGHGLVQGCTAIDLPPYQYAYGSVSYYESRFSKEYRSRSVTRHDLIGSKLPGNAKLRPQWRNILRLKGLSWLGDHRLLPHAVFPGAGYIAMAIEASSQVHHEMTDAPKMTGFSLRNVSINSALRIPEDDYGVEVLLTMELVDTSTAKSPAWATFSISSVAQESATWTEHCTGLIKVHVLTTPEKLVAGMSTDEMDARTVDSRPWYNKFADIGLGYGPAFQGLSEIRADPAKNLATAKLDLKTTTGTVKGGESSYPLHPASLDAIFQLGLIACHGGQVEQVHTAFVPINISQMYLRNGSNEDWGTAIASGELRGLRGAYAKLQLLDQSANLVLDITSFRCVSYSGDSQPSESSNHSNPFSSPFTRLSWKPDIRTITNRKAMEFFPPPQENADRAPLFESMHTIATLIVMDIYENFAGRQNLAVGISDQIHYFLAWIRRRVQEDKTESMTRARQLSIHERQRWLEKLYEETEDLVEVKIARRLHKDMEDILYDRRTGVEVLVEDGLLTAFYESGLAMTGAYPQLFRILDHLGHANPNQKILEVGAGTGGATRVAMKAFSDAGAIKRYSDYTFTDVSPGFLTLARESMAAFNDVSFSVLNIEENPLEQGHEPVYDLVIASQCLHATPYIANTLANCRKLLKPGGKLVLVENTQNAIGHGLVLGTLTGYWDGVPDGRIDSPFLDLESWNLALLKAGFSGTELVLPDYPSPHNTASTIVSTAITPEPDAGPNGMSVQQLQKKKSNGTAQVVHLLHGVNGAPLLLEELAQDLKSRGIPFKTLFLDDAIRTVGTNSRIIAFLDGENLLLEATASRLAVFQHLARCSSSMVWITSCGIVRGRNADGAVAAGLLRTIATENPSARFLFIDVDPESLASEEKGSEGENGGDLVRCIVDKEVELQGESSEESEDREFVWQNGCMWVSRIVPDEKLADQSELIKMPASRAELLPFDSQGPVRAAFQTPGILTSLYFKPYTELWQPLLPGDIELKVAAVGLNWKDLGISAGRFDANNLSSEYSGIITKLGTAVRGFSVGDRVYGMGKGHFGNYTRVAAKLAQKLGPSDNLVEVATMPLVYMTAVYAFEHVTQLKPGERVLIQSATGGLGLAAIQLAQARGAEVFATVGTAEKARFLTETAHIPASHIFGSREVSELPRAVAATGGRGFDVILSAPSKGDMLYASLKALHPLGRLIDVGRVDVLDAKALSLDLFQRSITFSSFDLGHVLDTDPEIAARLMEAVHRYYRQGEIGPVRPFTASDVSQLDQVLLGFSKGTHIGKLVVTFLDPEALVRMVPAVSAAKFDPESIYIITGGWGGLGRSIIRWMADRGARHVAVLSRSGPRDPAAETLIKDLGTRGITITPVLCDVSVKKNVLETVKKLSSKGQVKGMVHAAMSLQDLSFDKLSIEQWNNSLAAKVLGTKNLHEATANMPLDFFVMITSLESVVALATQSAYTAANNFQEAFARYRRSRGLPASTASFGLISDVGALGNTATTVNLMARNKVLAVTEHQFLNLLEPAFLASDRSSSTVTGKELQYDPLSAAGYIMCLDPAAMAAQKHEEAATGLAAGPTPRWYSDSRVSLIMRAFEDAYRHADDAAAAGEKDEASRSGGSAIAQLRKDFDEAMQGGPGERSRTEALVASAIVDTIAGMLSIDAAGVSQAKNVAEYGVDSLIAAELRNWFNVAFRTNIPLLDLLDTHISIKALAGIVVDKTLEKNLEKK